MSQLLWNQFNNPGSEYSPMPFWFWNDQLSKTELKKQIHDFKEKGVEGFVLHPRIGLPDNLEYLSDSFMEFVKFAVNEADKLGMHVILYDEAMYPSGAANGKVVERNPHFASKGLKAIEQQLTFQNNKLTMKQSDRLVALFLVRKIERVIDRNNIYCQYPLNVEIVEQKHVEDKIEVTLRDELIDQFFQSNNRNIDEWALVGLVETESHGTIRGVHEGQDDGEIHAPRSADLLNPEAVRTFIDITHERYKEVVGSYFGTTIFAVFTDEPDMLGRNAKEGLIPWTSGFENNFFVEGFHIEDLLALFFELDGKVEEVEEGYKRALHKRLLDSYYRPISEWCEQNNLSLTGHPAASDDIGLLKPFHIPGQDVVWRWVAPEEEKGIQGAHSTAGKCGADIARHYRRRRNINEFLGVCGVDNNWNLSAADMKWYIDWLAVRGVNLFCPHAFYYSIDGQHRSHERPPDVGPNNVWWPYYQYFSTYMKRLSWLLADSVNQAEVAILTKDDHLPWQAAKELFQNQIEFNYVNEKLFVDELVEISDSLKIAHQYYKVVILDQLSWRKCHPKVRNTLLEWVNQGGELISIGGEAEVDGITQLDHSIEMIEHIKQYQTVQLAEYCPDIRVSLVEKLGQYFYLIVNEGEEKFKGTVDLKEEGATAIWDPWTGKQKEAYFQNDELYLELGRRASLIIAVDPNKSMVKNELLNENLIRQLPIKWNPNKIPNKANCRQWSKDQLVSWTTFEELRYYSGTMSYYFEFDLKQDIFPIADAILDLGEVYEIAEIILNDHFTDVQFWAPYQMSIPIHVLKEGANQLEVKVTNNSANQMDQLALPSGLLGPVQLIIEHT
ncbi:glycosylhydrolase-like jelly roll fold domain-containing protein [Gracilibacillus lacisalsi]|uniref:glycosylhydrolase-like jelly roll fold domain-containing protein n=1 Tax=Gracilibacillus lacisalsi TaxID=393087 RepID=UPI00035FF49B|nr:glycosylhydrolase-like jelly roll fold domain-containing protein [Gracilibacillus lacisalsi]